MKEVLIVDGYNVIHAWPQLAGLLDAEKEHARDKLVDAMSEYAAVTNSRVVVVFDAHQVKGGLGSKEYRNNIEVIYSQEGETADSIIEKLVGSLVETNRVIVATSDWTQQRFIFGKGASRMSARELIQEIRRCLAEHKKTKEFGMRSSGHSLGSRLREDIKDILEGMRRQR